MYYLYLGKFLVPTLMFYNLSKPSPNILNHCELPINNQENLKALTKDDLMVNVPSQGKVHYWSHANHIEGQKSINNNHFCLYAHLMSWQSNLSYSKTKN